MLIDQGMQSEECCCRKKKLAHFCNVDKVEHRDVLAQQHDKSAALIDYSTGFVKIGQKSLRRSDVCRDPVAQGQFWPEETGP